MIISASAAVSLSASSLGLMGASAKATRNETFGTQTRQHPFFHSSFAQRPAVGPASKTQTWCTGRETHQSNHNSVRPLKTAE